MRQLLHMPMPDFQQHKSLLLFVGEKVIVVKVEVCICHISNHTRPPKSGFLLVYHHMLRFAIGIGEKTAKKEKWQVKPAIFVIG